MIVRLVKMTFHPENTAAFEAIFEDSKDKIRGFEGCLHVELLRHIENPCIYFTYSHWESPEALEAYRHSELFAGVWKATKALFSEKAEAHSLMKNDSLPTRREGMNSE
jgi:quinol monooxygenase YgiN